jgi:hypothetical protein
MAVNELLGIFFCGFIIWANKLYCPDDSTIYARYSAICALRADREPTNAYLT